MKRKKRFLVVSILLVFFVAGSLLVCQQRTVAMAASPGSANEAPDFTLPDLDGRPFSLSSTRGKVVILDFWATWCPPCRAEIPHFVDLYKKYKNKGLEIIGISLDRGGTDTVKSFSEANNINYPIVMGNQKIAADYGGIRGIPTTFIVDREGRVVEKFVGYRGKEVLESVIKKLL